jgi:uncharacterized membrane protein
VIKNYQCPAIRNRWVSNLPQRENRFSKMQANASQILKERFARGEIDIAEFELKKQIISN